VLELTPEGIHQYGGGYTEYVARTGHEAPGLHRWGACTERLAAWIQKPGV